MRAIVIILCCGLIAITWTCLSVVEIFLVRVLTLILLGLIVCVGFYWLGRINNTSRRAYFALFIGTLILAYVGFANVPLKVIFHIHEHRFEALSEKLIRGEELHYPIQIGPFKVIDGGVRDGSEAPYLMTSGHQSEINGFVRDSKGKCFNLWTITRVSKNWAYIEED